MQHNATPTHAQPMTASEIIAHLESVPYMEDVFFADEKGHTVKLWRDQLGRAYVRADNVWFPQGAYLAGIDGQYWNELILKDGDQKHMATITLDGMCHLHIQSGWFEILPDGGLHRIQDLESWLADVVDVDLEEVINDAYGTIDICGCTFYAYDILAKLDPILLQEAESEALGAMVDDAEWYPESFIDHNDLDGKLAYWDDESNTLILGPYYQEVE